MLKFQDLTTQPHERELAEKRLSTTGNKAELQSQLREHLEAEIIDLKQYKFRRKDGEATTKDVKKEAAVDSAKDLRQPSIKV